VKSMGRVIGWFALADAWYRGFNYKDVIRQSVLRRLS